MQLIDCNSVKLVNLLGHLKMYSLKYPAWCNGGN